MISQRNQEINNSYNFNFYKFILPVYFPLLLISICIGILAPAIPAKVNWIGGSIFLIGLIVGARNLGEAIFAVPVGIVINKLGTRITTITGSLGVSFFALIGGLSPNGYLLYFSIFFLGAFLGLFGISRHSYLSKVVPIDYRGKAFSRFGGVSRIGYFIGPLIGGFSAKYISFDIPFYIVFVISAIATLLMYFISSPEEKYLSQENKNTSKKVTQIIKENKYSLGVVGTGLFVLNLLRESRHIIIPLWAFNIGLEVDDLGIIQSISSAIDMTLFYPAGYVMDKFGRKWTSVPSIILLSLAFSLISFADSYQKLLLVGLILGISNGIGSGAMLTLGSDLAPEDSNGPFLGIWRLISWSGSGLASPLVGTIGQFLSLSLASFSITGIGFVGIVFFIFLVPETLKKNHNP